jgi:hypothetical protein
MKCGLFIGLHAGDTGHILREGLFESLLTASINPEDTPEAFAWSATEGRPHQL